MKSPGAACCARRSFLPGWDRIDVRLTDAGELIVIDIVTPAAVAPAITAFTCTGTVADGQTLTFAWAVTGFPDPVNLLRILVPAPEEGEQPTLIATVAGDPTGVSYTLDNIALGIAAGTELIFELASTNSAGSATATLTRVVEPGAAGPTSGFVGSRVAFAGTQATISVNVPAGTASGDTLIVHGLSNTGEEHAPPAGWTRHLDASGYAVLQLVDWNGFDTNYTFALDGGTLDGHGLIITTWRGYAIGLVGDLSNTAANPAPPNISNTVADAINVMFIGAATGGVTYFTPSGWTKLNENSNNRSVAVFQRDALIGTGTIAGQTVTRNLGSASSRAVQYTLVATP